MRGAVCLLIPPSCKTILDLKVCSHNFQEVLSAKVGLYPFLVRVLGVL